MRTCATSAPISTRMSFASTATLSSSKLGTPCAKVNRHRAGQCLLGAHAVRSADSAGVLSYQNPVPPAPPSPPTPLPTPPSSPPDFPPGNSPLPPPTTPPQTPPGGPGGLPMPTPSPMPGPFFTPAPPTPAVASAAFSYQNPDPPAPPSPPTPLPTPPSSPPDFPPGDSPLPPPTTPPQTPPGGPGGMPLPTPSPMPGPFWTPAPPAPAFAAAAMSYQNPAPPAPPSPPMPIPTPPSSPPDFPPGNSPLPPPTTPPQTPPGGPGGMPIPTPSPMPGPFWTPAPPAPAFAAAAMSYQNPAPPAPPSPPTPLPTPPSSPPDFPPGNSPLPPPTTPPQTPPGGPGGLPLPTPSPMPGPFWTPFPPNPAPHLVPAGAWGMCALFWSAPAWAYDAVAQPPMQEEGSGLNFGTVISLAILGYWLVKAANYLTRNKADANQGKDGSKEVGKSSDAQIRTFVDHSHDAQGIRNQSLAKAAEYSISTRVRESLPRIRTLVTEMSSQSELSRPHVADVDPVANLVWEQVLQMRQGQGGTQLQLSPAEQQRLEQGILEAVAEREAREQIQHFVDMANKGGLHAEPPLAVPSGGKGGK